MKLDEPFCYVALGTDHDDQLYWDKQQAIDDGYAFVEPLYRHPRQPVRLSDEEILTIAAKYGTSSTRYKPTYHLHDGSPTGETYPQTDWDIGQDDLLGFARELLEKNQ